VKILGLSNGAVSGAALLVDGEVVACASEERFSRVKNDESYPRRSIEYCLEHAGLDGSELDVVAIGSLEADLWHRITHYYSRFTIDDYVREQSAYWYPRLYENASMSWHELYRDRWDLDQYPGRWAELIGDLGEHYYLAERDRERVNEFHREALQRHIGVPKDRVTFVEHHTAHAAYGYWASPFRDGRACVLTIDAYGDGLSATISVGEDGRLERQKAIPARDFQLGRMYRYATLLLGMKPNEHEYKVMGLAAYAKPQLYERPYAVYRNTMYVDGLDFRYHERPPDMYFYFRERLEGCRFDGVAGGLQLYLEDTLTEWVRNALRATNTDRVVLSGGVAMNVKVMRNLAALPEVRELFVPPSASDESLAIGVCYHACATTFGVTPSPLSHAYLGPDVRHTDVRAAVDRLRSAGGSYEIRDDADTEHVIDRLADGRVVAVCSGRMEFGARALGNRSILADPRRPEIVHTLNAKIKNRDFWMPFAPAILQDRAASYLVNPKGLQAPFMTVAFDTTAEGARHLTAAIHPADRTARPQLVDPSVNPRFARLLRGFEARTGVAGVLNTSFNLHGEPIVCTAMEAARVFELTDIDDLLIGETLISKRSA
jgi:carbamoyltransferase